MKLELSIKFGLLLFLSSLFGQLTFYTIQSKTAIPYQIFDSSTLIYYRLDPFDDKETCLTHDPITLGEFTKRILSSEWIDSWGDVSGGMEALKAGAVAIRSGILSVDYMEDIIEVDGVYYYCTQAYHHQAFRPDYPIEPNAAIAVEATAGIIMTHSEASAEEDRRGWPAEMRTGAISAEYRDEIGEISDYGGLPWLKPIYDPIGKGTIPANYPYGLSQYGSYRWSIGLRDDGEVFPQWDFKRILAHYYSEVTFVGLIPDPPEGYRSNITRLRGAAPNGGLTISKGDTVVAVTVDYQNTGTWEWPTNLGNSAHQCPSTEPPEGWQTLLGYHLYRQLPDGSFTLACPEDICLGVRREPICRPQSLPVSPSDSLDLSLDLHIPDHPDIVEGETYILRFDVEHRQDSVWAGYSTDFAWPAQDVPVYVPLQDDSTPPTNPGLFVSRDGNHHPNTWSHYPTIQAAWEGASDAESGVYGYAVAWSNQTDTIPPSSVTTTNNQADSSLLDDGSWWLHLKTRDNAGNWTDEAVHFGPFLIDTRSPSMTVESPAWAITDTFPITWYGFDAGGLGASGVVSFSFDYQRDGGGWSEWFTTTLTGTILFNQGGQADEYISVRGCAYDQAGNADETCFYNTTTTQIRLDPYLIVNPPELSHCIPQSTTWPLTFTLDIGNEGAGTLAWTAIVEHLPPMFSLVYTTGNIASNTTVEIPYTISRPISGTIDNSLSYGIGIYTGVLTITAPINVRHSSASMPVLLEVVKGIKDCLTFIYLPFILKP